MDIYKYFYSNTMIFWDTPFVIFFSYRQVPNQLNQKKIQYHWEALACSLYATGGFR